MVKGGQATVGESKRKAEAIAKRADELNKDLLVNPHPNRIHRHRFAFVEDTGNYAIYALRFGVFSHEKRKAISVRTITQSTLYEHGGMASDDAPMSPYLGSNNPSHYCKHCGNRGGTMGPCNGHFGIIEFALPVYNTIWLPKLTIKMLRMVCFWCSHPIRDTEHVTAKVPKKALVQYLENCKARKVCENCGGKCQPTYAREDHWIVASWDAKSEFDSPEEEAFAKQPFTVRSVAAS